MGRMQNNAGDFVELGEKLDRLRARAGRLANRVRLWANSRLSALHLGMLMRPGRPDPDTGRVAEARYMWQLGATEKHCSDCLRLNGQVHTASEWRAYGLYPQSKDLECGGWWCDCKLLEVETESQGTQF